MRKILTSLVLLLVATASQAQRIAVVDSNGNGIHLVTVLSEDGNMIGITNLEGMTPDLGGAVRIVLTHVAFKPKVVDVQSVQGGKVTMEDLDYNLAEIVVKPKPLIYVETFYRVYGFADNSLRYYLAGIMPNTYDVEKKKELKKTYVSPMKRDALETYATSHHIPALTPTIRRAIEGLKK